MKDAWGALSDKTRREILFLLKNRPYTAGEIVDQFELSPATVSHHLGVLKQGGLVRADKRAQTIIYSMNRAALQELQRTLTRMLKD